MGVDLGSIIEAEPIDFKALKHRVIAIDAYNTLYQFLSIIRQPDGTPLKDAQGRITSHLSGLFYRTSKLLEFGIKPVYVFDGTPPMLKKQVIEQRIAIRERARAEWELALAENDLEKARKWSQQSSRLTKEIIDESKLLLSFMGVPWIQAPAEGEAQASYMAYAGDVYAAGSQDYDSLLFSAPILIRNLSISGRRKVPRKKIYKEITPELIDLHKNLQRLQINQEQLVDIGILVGTDFNKGVKNIGPKKALTLIKKYGSIENIVKEKGIKLENYEEVRKIFLEPKIIKDYTIQWYEVKVDKLVEFMCEEHDFSSARVNSTIEKLLKFRKIQSQTSLSNWL